MSLADLTSRAAVEQALDEYDRLGRDAFLSKYQFGESRTYFVLSRGKRYDSKAIVGAAYGFQYPDRGALRANEFSGGEDTVKRCLSAMGYTVTSPTSGKPQPGVALEQAFRDRMLQIYESAKIAGYEAARFRSMLNDDALATARALLRSPIESNLFRALAELGRLDLSVEAAALESQWTDLFSDEERSTASERLRTSGFHHSKTLA